MTDESLVNDESKNSDLLSWEEAMADFPNQQGQLDAVPKEFDQPKAKGVGLHA